MPRPPKAAAGSQSLERGLDVLEVVEAEGADIGVREIARRLDLSPTIVQRLVTSLARRGYVDKNLENARYRLGYRALALGAHSSGADYIGTARRELEQLARGHSLNGFVAVLHGGRAVYLLAVQAEGPVAIKVAPGSEMPLHSTAAGKVLLASVSDSEARKLLGNGKQLAAITPNTVTDPAVLIASLARVRKQGFATVAEENIRGVLSVGAPIRDHSGKILAALSVAFPKYLDSAVTLQSITPHVVAAAQRISRVVGGLPTS